MITAEPTWHLQLLDRRDPSLERTFRCSVGRWTMDDEDTKANFDRLANAALLELCSEPQGHGPRPRGGIREIRENIYSNDKYSNEEKKLFWEVVKLNILFRSEFEYACAQPEGQVDHGSYLHLACRHNKYELVKEIVDEAKNFGPSIVQYVLNSKSRKFHRTPLHEALIMASCRETNSVSTLLENDACSLSEPDRDGMTPLHLAATIAASSEDLQYLTFNPSARKVFEAAAQRSQLQLLFAATDPHGKIPMELAIGAWTIEDVTDMLSPALKVISRSVTSVARSSRPFSANSIENARNEARVSTIKSLLHHIIKAENLPLAVQFLKYMFKLRKKHENILENSYIEAMIEEAVQQNSLELVNGVKELIDPWYRTGYVDVAARQTMELFFVESTQLCSLTAEILASMYSGDGALAMVKSRTDRNLLGAMLQKALSTDARKLLVALCTHTNTDELCQAASADALDAVLHYAWKNRLSDILCHAPIADLVEASRLKQSTEVRLEYLQREVDDDPNLRPTMIAVCVDKDVLKACPAETRKVLQNSLTKQNLYFVRKCCKAGILDGASQEVKRHVMREAAWSGDIVLASLCIEVGALHGIKRWEDHLAFHTAKRRGHDRLARLLQKALDDQNLLDHGDQPVRTVLLRIGGPPGAGKSTMARSLKTTRLRGTFRRESQADEGARNYLARTKGIQVHVYKDDGTTRYHVLDLGGHDDFAAAHQLFIGQGKVPIVNMLVISGLLECSEMLKEMMKWCAFFASQSLPPLTEASALDGGPDQPQQPIVVVATRLREAGPENKRNVISCFGKAKLHYQKFLDFQQGPMFIDARKSWDEATIALRQTLALVKKREIQKGLREPALCNDVRRALPHIRGSAKGPLVSRDELFQLFSQSLTFRFRKFDENVLASHSETFDAVLRSMSDAAEIISFQKPELKKYIVVEPQWLLSHIVGILMSPEHFPPPHVVYHHGRTKRSLAEAAVNNPHMPGKDTLEMVAQLGLCILEEEDMIVPSKLDTKRDTTTWIARDDLDLYFGIKFICHDVPMSPALVPQLQVHLYNKFLELCGQVSKLWKDGIHVTLQNSNAEGLLEAQRDQMAINVAVRGSSSLARDAYHLLQLLREQVLFKAEEFSPGSDMSVKILSSEELRQLADKGSPKPPSVCYDEEDVKKAMEQAPRLIRPRDGSGEPEDPFALMALPPTHLLLMSEGNRIRFCEVMNSRTADDELRGKRSTFAKYLGAADIPLRSTEIASDPTGKLLMAWAHQSAHNTVDRLLEVVTAMQQHEAAAILKAELHLIATKTITTIPRNVQLTPLDCKTGGTADSGTSSHEVLARQPGNPVWSTELLKSAQPSAVAEPTPLLAEAEKLEPCHNRISTSLTAANPDERGAYLRQETNSADDQLVSLEESTMLKIAECFTNIFDCQKLAVFLSLSQESGFVDSLQSVDPHSFPSKIAFAVMRQWVRENGSSATEWKLHDVLLHDLCMASAAEKLEVSWGQETSV